MTTGQLPYTISGETSLPFAAAVELGRMLSVAGNEELDRSADRVREHLARVVEELASS
ncbi:MAG: hypothetical protein K0S10_1138 [Rubrobacteraceae bacterium]|jgi:hypothetical protein|nr:hypothetical protein [Rubrobacteraceae bacterium]